MKNCINILANIDSEGYQRGLKICQLHVYDIMPGFQLKEDLDSLVTLSEIESDYCEEHGIKLGEILVEHKYNESLFNASTWRSLNSEVMWPLFPADILSNFIMSRLDGNKSLYYEVKKTFMNSFSSAMFYSFQQNSEIALQDLAIDLRSGKCYIDNVNYDKS